MQENSALRVISLDVDQLTLRRMLPYLLLRFFCQHALVVAERCEAGTAQGSVARCLLALGPRSGRLTLRGRCNPLCCLSDEGATSSSGSAVATRVLRKEAARGVSPREHRGGRGEGAFIRDEQRLLELGAATFWEELGGV